MLFFVNRFILFYLGIEAGVIGSVGEDIEFALRPDIVEPLEFSEFELIVIDLVHGVVGSVVCI